MSIVDIAIIATPVIILVGFVFMYRQLKANQNTRLAQIILSMTEQWDGPVMKEGRRKVNACGTELKARIEKEQNDPNSEELYNLVGVANFFDSLGLLVMEGLIDTRVAFRLLGRAEDYHYNLYRPLLEEPNYKDYFKYFLELHDAFISEKAKLSKKKPRPFR